MAKMTATRKPVSPYRTTFHRDDTVTYWDVYAQQWSRQHAATITDDSLSTLPLAERDRIVRMAGAR